MSDSAEPGNRASVALPESAKDYGRTAEAGNERPSKRSCPNAAQHTPEPDGYLGWHAWAAKMSRKHRQVRCPECGLWAIWVPKGRPARRVLLARLKKLRTKIEKVRIELRTEESAARERLDLIAKEIRDERARWEGQEISDGSFAAQLGRIASKCEDDFHG